MALELGYDDSKRISTERKDVDTSASYYAQRDLERKKEATRVMRSELLELPNPWTASGMI